MFSKQSSNIIVLLVACFVLVATTLVSAQTTTTTTPSTVLRQFTVRSKPFSNGNDASTFDAQLNKLVVRLANVLGNTSSITLNYNVSSQSQQCWADVQECSQTFTWWFNGTAALQNQQLFLTKSYTDDEAATVLDVEVFREGTMVPAKVRTDPSIMPFLMTLCFTYGAISLGSIIIMIVGYKIASR